MARRDNDRTNDDVDGRPGGNRISSEYANRYDPQGELETTNIGLENHQQVAADFERQRSARYLREVSELEESAMSRIHYWPNVGRFIVPRENSFAAHAQLVKGTKDADLHFDPETYVYFDKVLADRAGRPDLFDREHPDYAKNAAARVNLAVLRNDIMGWYMDDESFDPGDEKFVPKLQSISREIGDALAREKYPLGIGHFTGPVLNTELLNMEGDGAAHAYKMLLKRQRHPVVLGTVQAQIRDMLGVPKREWDLPPIEDTPFSEEGLSAPAPADALCMTQPELLDYCRNHHEQQQQKGQDLDMGALHRELCEGAFDTPPSLAASARAEAERHGKIIWEWLKNIRFTDKSLEGVLKDGTPQEQDELKNSGKQLLDYFDSLLSRNMSEDPSLAENARIREGKRAAEAIQHTLDQLQARLEKPKSIAATMQISTDDAEQVKNSHGMEKQGVNELMQRIKEAAEELHAHQQEQQAGRDEDIAEQAVEAGLSERDRKRRRRRKQLVSGKGGKEQVEINRRLSADDRAAGQGAYQALEQRQQSRVQRVNEQVQTRAAVEAAVAQALRTAPASNTPITLSGDALQQALESGRALNRAGETAQALPPPEPPPAAPGAGTPPGINPFAPAGEQPFAAQEQGKRQRDTQPPQGGGNNRRNRRST